MFTASTSQASSQASSQAQLARNFTSSDGKVIDLNDTPGGAKEVEGADVLK